MPVPLEPSKMPMQVQFLPGLMFLRLQMGQLYNRDTSL
jgi:hypothetical protein